MNIVIPMAGLGSRFPSDKYLLPKPLIDAGGGMPMIVKAIKTLELDGRYHFIISKNKFTQKLKDVIWKEKSDSVFVEIDYLTEGPASSCLLMKEYINNDDELVIANCDQIMSWNSKLFLHNVRLFDGAVVTFFGNNKKYSFAKLNYECHVNEIKEKEVISNIALNGIHYWKKGKYFVSSAEEMIKLDVRADNGEFYVGPSYNHMINKGLSVGIYHIPNEQHHGVGVPEDLDYYLTHYAKNHENI